MPLSVRTQDPSAEKLEGGDFGYTISQVRGRNGSLLASTDVESVYLSVWDLTDEETELYTVTLSPSAVFFGSASAGVLDATWNEEARVGYNFRHYLAHGDVFTTLAEVGGHRYRLEYRIQCTTANGTGVVMVPREFESIPVLTSSSLSVEPPPPPPPVTDCPDGLGNGLDGDGYTVFTPTTGSTNPTDDSLKIYVDSARPDDTGDGLSPAAAKKTIVAGYALLRDGYPDYLYLRKSGVWNDQALGDLAPNLTDPGDWKKSGKSASEPMVVTTYGSGVRPKINHGLFHGFSSIYGSSNSFAHVAVVGVHFDAHTWNGTNGLGFPETPVNVSLVRWTCSCLHFEDCVFDSGNLGVNILYVIDEAGRHTDFRFHRCQFLDALGTPGLRSNGFYARSMTRMSVTECLFDRNGYDSLGYYNSNVFSHNIYMANNTEGISFEGCVSSRGGSHGIQLRGGGTLRNSFFSRASIAMTLGGGDEPADRVVLDVVGNVVIDGRDIIPNLNVLNSTWVNGTLTLTVSNPASAFALYPASQLTGKTFTVLTGTGATPGDYLIASGTSTTLVLTSSIGAGAVGNITGYVSSEGLWRGWGPQMTHIASGEVAYNIVAHQESGHFSTPLGMSGNPTIDQPTGGFFDVDLHHNIFYEWGGSTVLDSGAGFMSGNTARSNVFYGDPSPDPFLLLMFHDYAATAAACLWTDNQFLSINPDPDWFLITSTPYNLADWQVFNTGSGNTVFAGPSAYTDPNRTPATYMDMVLSTTGSTFETFFTACRSQGSDSTTGRGTWNPDYTAAAINDYIRAGFDMVLP